MRYDLQDGGRFEVQPGRGLVGGDLECDATLVPGMCALDNIRQVSRVCNTNRTDCDAVVLYYAGACTRVVNRCAWRERVCLALRQEKGNAAPGRQPTPFVNQAGMLYYAMPSHAGVAATHCDPAACSAFPLRRPGWMLFAALPAQVQPSDQQRLPGTHRGHADQARSERAVEQDGACIGRQLHPAKPCGTGSSGRPKCHGV